jgi:hypothetical protein
MRLFRNKASGQYFIAIEDDEFDNEILMITPEGKIKRLERRLFDPIYDKAKELWINIETHVITPSQRDKYYKYVRKSRSKHNTLNF